LRRARGRRRERKKLRIFKKILAKGTESLIIKMNL
jgi:hypothetical protein